MQKWAKIQRPLSILERTPGYSNLLLIGQIKQQGPLNANLKIQAAVGFVDSIHHASHLFCSVMHAPSDA